MRLAVRICVLAALAALAACAAPGPHGKRAGQPPAAARRPPHATAPVRHAPAAKPGVGVLDPADYRAGQARRIHVLLGLPGLALAKDRAGYYMEVEEAKLRQLTSGSNVRIVARGQSLFVAPQAGAFASGAAGLAAGMRTLLAAVTPVFEEFAKTLITVHGYTDSTGAADANRRLSERRAWAVARYLLHAGVGGERIVVVGHGEADPVASNATAKGRARNRRIVIELEPITP